MPDSVLQQPRVNEDGVRTFPRYFEEFQSTSGEAFRASFMDSFTFAGSFSSLARQVDYAEKNRDLPSMGYKKPLSRLLTSDEANERAKSYGLSFDEPIREDALSARIDRRKDVLRRESVIARAPDSLGRNASVIGGMVLGALADPANIALSLVPVVGEARFAWMAKTLGGVGRARLARGAIEGAVGNALFEPAALAIAANEQDDYTMWDSLTNIALGGVVGGGLHFTGGYIKDRFGGRITGDAVPDRIEAAHPLTREAALRTSVADLSEGRWVDVEPHFSIDERVNKEISAPVSLQDYSFKARGVSQETYLRFQKRFEGEAALVEEGKFTSRAEADKYIREKAKELGISRGDFFIERADDEVTVLRGHDTVTPEIDEKGAVREFKSHAEAKKFAAAKEMETSGKWTGYAISLNPKKGKAGQRHIVIGGEGMTEGMAKRIKENPEMVTFVGRQTLPERPVEKTADFKKVAQGFSDEKNRPSALTRDMEDVPEAATTVKQEFSGEDAESIQSAIEDTQAQLDELRPMMENLDEELRKALGTDKIDDELKALDKEIGEAETMAEAIRGFTNCMLRG